MKTNEEIVDEFRKQFPPFKGVGARFPMFAETPVYTHVIQFIERALEAKDKECEERVREERERLVKWAQDNAKQISDSYPFDSKYDHGDFISTDDLMEWLTPTKTDKREQL